MARKVYVYKDGQMWEKGTEPRSTGVMIAPDLPDFVSPIDGKTYRGRAGMREHNALHDVVPTADLKGLPWKTKATEYKPDSKAIRETIIETMHRKGYWDKL